MPVGWGGISPTHLPMVLRPWKMLRQAQGDSIGVRLWEMLRQAQHDSIGVTLWRMLRQAQGDSIGVRH